MNTFECWEELEGAFDDDYIRNLVAMLYEKAKVFYEGMGLRNIAYFDEEIFSRCVIDILFDLKRLKEFHEIDNVSYERIIAYSAGWVARRHPFQMIQPKSGVRTRKKYQHINEKFALILLSEIIGQGDGKLLFKKGKSAQAERLLSRVLYHLCFRNSEPRVMELLITGFELGMIVE